MSWIVGTVTLPKSPATITLSGAAKIDELDQSGNTPRLSSIGLEAIDFTLNGVLGSGATALSSLITNYATPLWNYKGGTVVVSTPYSLFNGTYMVAGVDFNFSNEDPHEVAYSIKFKKGSGYSVV